MPRLSGAPVVALLLSFAAGSAASRQACSSAVTVSRMGNRLASVALVERLHELGGAHGVRCFHQIDRRGRDILSRLIYGSRLVLFWSSLATIASMASGRSTGAASKVPGTTGTSASIAVRRAASLSPNASIAPGRGPIRRRASGRRNGGSPRSRRSRGRS